MSLLRALNVDDTLTAPADAWNSQSDCDHITQSESSEFFRIWVACICYGAGLLTVILVPYTMCSDNDDKEFDSDKPAETIPGLDELRESTKKKNEAKFHKSATSHIAKDIDFKAAKEHFRRSSPTDVNGKWRSVWHTRARDMSEVGGIGIELYFRLLRILGVCFAVKTIFSLPVLAMSVHGTFVPQLGTMLSRTTVGNLGNLQYLAEGGSGAADRLVVLGCQGQTLRDITPIFGWLDFSGTLVFTIIVLYFRFRFLPRAAKKDDAENITCRDFAIEVDCLPRVIPEQQNYEAQLAEHFLDLIKEARAYDKTGKKMISDPRIAEVSLCRDFDEHLSVVKYRNELAEMKRIAEDKGEEAVMSTFLCCCKKPLQTLIDKQDAILNKALKSPEQLPVLRAFLIINTPDDASRILTMYRFSKYNLLRCCQSRKLCFHGSGLRVRRAPEPTNIIWENQDVPWQKRYALQGVLFLIWLIVVILAIVLVFFVQKSAQNVGSNDSVQVVGEKSCDAGTEITDNTYVCDASVAILWTVAMAQNMTNKDDIGCFCSTKGQVAIMQDRLLWDDVCEDWLIEGGRTTLIGLASSVVTVLINAVLLQLVLWMVSKEKHPSISAQDSSIMFKITWSQFGNLACIVFLIHFYYEPLKFILNGQYSDFERGWYATVGSTLVMNMFLNSFVNSFQYIAFWWLAILYRCRCCTRRIKHQVELLAVYTNPEFDVAARYAGILVTVLATLTYSAGLPVLNFCATVYFFLTFWTDKWIILHGSKRPPLYDTQMPKNCTEMMLIALPIHVFVAMFMFSHACTFPSNKLGGKLAEVAAQGSGAVQQNQSTQSLEDRITKESSWMFFVLGVILLAGFFLYLLLLIVGATFGTAASACFSYCCPSRHQTLPETQEELTWDKVYPMIMGLRPPASYRMENIPGLQVRDIFGKAQDANTAVVPLTPKDSPPE